MNSGPTDDADDTGSTDSTGSTPVAVIGRGPVGMTLALRLARFGVRTVLVDPHGPEVEPGSKAVLMAQQAVDILSSVGVGDAMVEEGVSWRVSRTHYRDRELFAARLAAPAEGLLPPVLNFPQSRTEALLTARVESEPLITSLRLHRLVGLAQDADGVTAQVTGPHGTREIRASYLAGCDGARSATRKLLDIPFDGYGHDDHFLIADIRAQLPFPQERRFFFNPSFNPGRTVLIHPQPDSCWHIDWQIGPAVDADEEQRSGRLDARLRDIIGDTDYELLWLTTYRFKQLAARRFRGGRAFLVGDAAHLTSPYGARGLNSGIADADNLAWKLWLVCTGQADPALLDGYEAERRPAALENLRVTGATARFMCPVTRTRRWRRDLTLAAASRVPQLVRFVDSGHFYAPAVYTAPTPPRQEPVGEGARPTAACPPPRAGTLAPDGPVGPVRADGPAHRRLGTLLRDGFVALVFGALDTADRRERLAEHIGAAAAASTVTRLRFVLVGSPADATDTINTTEATDAGDATRYQPPADVAVIHDTHGELTRSYCPDGPPPGIRAFLIRPDGYIAGHFDLTDTARLAAHLAELAARTAPSTAAPA